MKIVCDHCHEEAEKEAGHVNRSRKMGMKLYCSKLCSTLARKVERSIRESKEMKRLYDIEYRALNADKRKQQKREWFQRTYDPKKAREERKLKMPSHIEYCRTPHYRAWKARYDRNYLARKHYGEFAEAALVLRGLESEIDSRLTRYEIRKENGVLNKPLQRKRDYGRFISKQTKDRPLGNP